MGFFRRLALFRLVMTLGFLVLGMTVRAVHAAVDWSQFHRTAAEVLSVDATCRLEDGDAGGETDCGKLNTFYAGHVAQVTTAQVRYVSPADGQPHQGSIELADRRGQAGLPEVGRPWAILASSSTAERIKPLP